MTLSRLKTVPYAAGLAVLMALAGCGTPEAAPAVQTPVGSSAASSAASATGTGKATTAPVDPVLARIPAAARPETREGAEAFGKFFLESLNTAARTPDPAVLDGLFQPECKTCVAMRDSVADLKRQGRQHAADTVRVLSTDPIVFARERRAVRVEIDQIAVDVRDRSGRTVYRTQAGRYAFAITLAFKDGHWVITKLQTLA